MLPSTLHALAEALVLYDADRSPERVAIANSAVGVSRGLRAGEAWSALVALSAAIKQHVMLALPAGASGDDATAIVGRLVETRDDGAGRYTVLVCGSELVGAEEPAAAESRARAMRAFLVAELQRALSDEPPATVRRSVQPSGAEAR